MGKSAELIDWFVRMDARFRVLLPLAMLGALSWTVVLAQFGFGDYALADPRTYWKWLQDAAESGQWPLVDHEWVYPPAALLLMAPLLLLDSTSAAVGFWFLLSVALNALVLIRLGKFGARGRLAAWFWVVFVGLMGAASISRLESVTAPLALIALTYLGTRPAVMVALLSVGGWIKLAPWVWLAPLVLLRKVKLSLAMGVFLAVSALVYLPFLILGGWKNSTSFLGSQTGRGLQAESFWALPLHLGRNFGSSPGPQFDGQMLTYEFTGNAANALASAANLALPVLVFGSLALVCLAAWRKRTGEDSFDLVAASTLLLTASLILGNKVGSPQFSLWLAPILASALVFSGDRKTRKTWAIWGIVLALLTLIQYPLAHGSVINGGLVGMAAIFGRLVCICVLAISALRIVWKACRTPVLEGSRSRAGDA